MAAVALLIVITVRWNFFRADAVVRTTDDAYVRADIVSLSTRVTDTLKTLSVQDYQPVHAGDMLAQLDDTDYQADLDKSKAALREARVELAMNGAAKQVQAAKIDVDDGKISQAMSDLSKADSEVEQAQAALIQADKERARQQRLLDQQATTPRDYEKAVSQDDQAKGKLDEALAAVADAKSAIDVSRSALKADRESLAALQVEDQTYLARIAEKNAGVQAAAVQLGYTRIVAPVDGRVGERKVFPGQLVSPGVEVLQLVESKVWIQANFEEIQISGMQVGDAADVRVDAVPGVIFHGKVTEIAPASGSESSLLPPDNATGNFTKVVQRVPVKVVLEADERYADRLRPGLSAEVKVRTR